MPIREEREVVRAISFLDSKGRSILKKALVFFKSQEEAEKGAGKTIAEHLAVLEQDMRNVKIRLASKRESIRNVVSQRNIEIEELERAIDVIDYEEEKKNIATLKVGIREEKDAYNSVS